MAASTRTKSNWKLSEFVAHGSNVNCLALSPNSGHMLATGGDDRKINLWLVGKPNNIMSISGMTSPVQTVTFNDNENWIAAGSKSGVIKVFDLEENRSVRSISGHKSAVSSLDFHNYGQIIASGSMDTNLKVWDVRRKGCVSVYKGHSDTIGDIRFTPDGKWVVSASDDSTIKIWDLVAGKMAVDFKTHNGPVTSIQFHPREFLMASGSKDRTVKFYELERFRIVSETPPESNGIMKMLFHPSGTALFTGTQESLKVHGWEPLKVYDMLPLRWGKVDDMTISGEQLIAASYANTNVCLWCIDIKQLRPFSGDTTSLPAVPSEPAVSDPSPPAPPLSASGRQWFENENQEDVPPPPAPDVPVGGPMNSRSGQEKERISSVSSEDGNDEEGSPPTQIKEKDRMELFAPRQRLVRSPPKVHHEPFIPPEGEDSPPHQHHPPTSPSHQHHHKPPSSELDRVQHIPNFDIKQNSPPSRPVKAAKADSGASEPARRLHQADHPARSAHHNAAVSKPELDVRDPSREMLKDFIPPQKNNYPRASAGVPSSSSRAIGDIVNNHMDISQILKNRLQLTKAVRAEWSSGDPKLSLEKAVNSNNASVLVDVLSVLYLKRTLWTLDMSLIVLPELNQLIHSKYKVYAICACNVTKLILKSFGPVIKNNIVAPPQGGRDLQREQRYDKCQSCYAHLKSLREEVGKIVRDSSTSPAGKAIRERALLAAFTSLD